MFRAVGFQPVSTPTISVETEFADSQRTARDPVLCTSPHRNTSTVFSFAMYRYNCLQQKLCEYRCPTRTIAAQFLLLRKINSTFSGFSNVIG